MSKNPWGKAKRRLQCACHFGSDDFIIGGVTLNSVHEFPFETWAENQEVDFYMDNGDDIFLLRVRNNDKNIITIYHDREIVDIVVETRMREGNTAELEKVINMLKRINYERISSKI